MNQKNPKQTNKQTNKQKRQKSKKTSASTVQDASVNTSKKDENKTTERLAFRLNSLQDKKTRFELHKSFLKSFFFFFICYLAAPQPTLGHCQGGSLTNPMFIDAFVIYSTRRSSAAL